MENMNCKNADCYYCAGGACAHFAKLDANNCIMAACPLFLKKSQQDQCHADLANRHRTRPRAQQMAAIRARMDSTAAA